MFEEISTNPIAVVYMDVTSAIKYVSFVLAVVFVFVCVAAVQTQIQWRWKDQDYWQYLHGCDWAERITWAWVHITGRLISHTQITLHHMSFLKSLTSPYHFCCWFCFLPVTQEHDRQYMHLGTMLEFAFALVGKLDVINKHSFNDFKLRVGEWCTEVTFNGSIQWYFSY